LERRRDFIHPPIAAEFLNSNHAGERHWDNLAMSHDKLGYRRSCVRSKNAVNLVAHPRACERNFGQSRIRSMPPRHLPDDPLPPYTYVPGRTPHPISDPAGHSFGHRPAPLASFDPEKWRDCRPYLRGIDLFNHGYYWEAHEAWEVLWHAAGKRGPTADFIKALVQLAVAGVKYLEDKPTGQKTHATRAAELFQKLQVNSFLGLRVSDLIALAGRMAEKNDESANWNLAPS
jgi:hypothetical protein